MVAFIELIQTTNLTTRIDVQTILFITEMTLKYKKQYRACVEGVIVVVVLDVVVVFAPTPYISFPTHSFPFPTPQPSLLYSQQNHNREHCSSIHTMVPHASSAPGSRMISSVKSM
jgi:hypothetical protein